MKNIFKYLSLAAISALAMTACSEDGPDYAGPGESSNAPGVVFASSAASAYTLTPSETVLNIPVTRTDAAAAASYDVSVVKNEDNALVVPAQVSFAAGAKETVLAIGIASNFAVGDTKELQVAFSEDLKSPYTNGNSVLITKITRDYVWNDLGVATMDEGFLGVRLESHLYQRSDDAAYYRLEYPYTDEAYIAADAKSMMGGEKQEYIEFTVKNDVVTWGKWNTGLLYEGEASQPIFAYQPSTLSSKLNDDNTVVNYNEDGSISNVVFSPYYYIPDLGGFGEIECVLYWPDYVFPAEEEEEEEEVGQDFFAGAAIKDYVGEYTMTYNNGKSDVSEDVTITNNGNNTVTIASFNGGVSIVLNYFGGLLYLGTQEVVIPGYEKYSFAVYVADEDDNAYDNAYMYAGFDEEGVLKIKNYPYNVAFDEDGNMIAAPKMVGFYVADLSVGAWGYYTNISLVKKSANKSASLPVKAAVRRIANNVKVAASAPVMMVR